MKILDFDHGRTKLDKINNYLEETFGFSIKQNSITPKALQNILLKVKNKQSEIVNESNVTDFHKHPEYAKTIMIAEALTIMLKEIAPTQRKMKAKVKESKMTKKVQEHEAKLPHRHLTKGDVDADRHASDRYVAKQLKKRATPPEQHLNKLGDSVNPRSVTLENFRNLMEQDLDQAELVLASKDMVDRLQKMAEDLASMQVEDLMPLVDAMRESFGTEQANMFSQTADAILGAALETIKTTREGMDQAVLVLTGEGAPTNDMMGGEMPPAGDMSAPLPGEEMVVPAEDEFAGDEAAAGVEGDPLGRIPKESVQLAKTLLLQHAQNGKLSKASIKEAAQILAQKKKFILTKNQLRSLYEGDLITDPDAGKKKGAAFGQGVKDVVQLVKDTGMSIADAWDSVQEFIKDQHRQGSRRPEDFGGEPAPRITSWRQADKMRRQKLMRYAEIQKRRDGSPSQASKDYATLGVDAANYVYDKTVGAANYVSDEFGDVVDATGDFVTTAIDTATDNSTPDSRRAIASSNMDNSTKTKVSKPKGYKVR